MPTPVDTLPLQDCCLSLAVPVRTYCDFFAHRTTIHEMLRLVARSSLKHLGVEVPYGPSLPEVGTHTHAPMQHAQFEKAIKKANIPFATNNAVLAYAASVAEHIKFVNDPKLQVFCKYGRSSLKSLNKASAPHIDELMQLRHIFNHPEDHAHNALERKENLRLICAAFQLQYELDRLLLRTRCSLLKAMCQQITPLDERIVRLLQAGTFKRVLERNNDFMNESGAAKYKKRLSELSSSAMSDLKTFRIRLDKRRYYKKDKDYASSVVMLWSSLLPAQNEICFEENDLDRVLASPAKISFPNISEDSNLARYAKDCERALSWLLLALDFWNKCEEPLILHNIGPDARHCNIYESIVVTSIHLLRKHIELLKLNLHLSDHDGDPESKITKDFASLMREIRNTAAHSPAGISKFYDGKYYFGKLDLRNLISTCELDPIPFSHWREHFHDIHDKLRDFYQFACQYPDSISFPEQEEKERTEKKFKPCT